MISMGIACLQSVVSMVTKLNGVLPMCKAAASVNALKLPSSVVEVVAELHVCMYVYI